MVRRVALGLRQGEALGPRWDDIDLERCTLRVRHALQRIDGAPRLVEPKTAQSRRALAVPPTIAGALRIKSGNKKWVPDPVYVRPDGQLLAEPSPGALSAWIVPAPFRFCLNCGVAYAGRQADFGKLAELATKGRSTATTVLSLAIVGALRSAEDLTAEARKLLSFTDNQQDASLQAGPFNDFVQVGLLRGALFAAVRDAGSDGVTHEVIARRVTEALALPFAEYARNPEAAFLQKQKTEQALRDVVGYRLYRDLRRGWRVNAPNLEQTGLLKVRYDALNELCAAEEVWRDRHWVLAGASPAERERACEVVLDFFRRELAIRVPYLDAVQQEAIKSNSYQYLVAPWAFEEDEDLEAAKVVRVGPSDRRARYAEATVSATSALGRYLRRRTTWGVLSTTRPTRDLEAMAGDLLAILTVGGQVEPVDGSGKGTEPPVYQLNAARSAGRSAMAPRRSIRNASPDPRWPTPRRTRSSRSCTRRSH